jgi:hypothetical protein
LKENYWDLEKKRVFCDNEAEMRCYMVLMNLNQGDILRSVSVIIIPQYVRAIFLGQYLIIIPQYVKAIFLGQYL